MKDRNIKEFLSMLSKSGIQISVENNDLDVKVPKGRVTKDMIHELKRRKYEIINYLAGVLFL